jgi:3D (Asp-Asp-Asp) domain-containing protein
LETRRFLRLFASVCLLSLLYACSSPTPLPPYERPLAKTDFQTVRTTAYTHTESDHLEYGNHNALGGTLQAAAPPYRSAAAEVRRAQPVYDNSDVQPASYSGTQLQPFSLDNTTTVTTRGRYRPERSTYALPMSNIYGSAAADWSRWPAGTIFRLLSTGQVYKVDDYGWALAGRNTIDLYMSTRSEMNNWGARAEQIQVLQWGDPQESLRLLQAHQNYRHIKRMVLELEGRDRDAAALE